MELELMVGKVLGTATCVCIRELRRIVVEMRRIVKEGTAEASLHGSVVENVTVSFSPEY